MHRKMNHSDKQIISVRGFTPQLGQQNFIAPGAFIIGDVITGDDCSFWFNSVVRGDVNAIRIGNRVNVQDGAVIHCTYQKTVADIGNEVSIGHNALVHGCRLFDRVLVGMGAIVMDNAVVESDCLIAAGAVVLENTVLKSGGVYAGIPARRVKELTPELFEGEIKRIAGNYRMYASWFQKD